MTFRRDMISFQHPLVRPFVPLAAPVTVENPTDAEQAQVIHFFATGLRGYAPEVAPAGQ